MKREQREPEEALVPGGQPAAEAEPEPEQKRPRTEPSAPAPPPAPQAAGATCWIVGETHDAVDRDSERREFLDKGWEYLTEQDTTVADNGLRNAILADSGNRLQAQAVPMSSRPAVESVIVKRLATAAELLGMLRGYWKRVPMPDKNVSLAGGGSSLAAVVEAVQGVLRAKPDLQVPGNSAIFSQSTGDFAKPAAWGEAVARDDVGKDLIKYLEKAVTFLHSLAANEYAAVGTDLPAEWAQLKDASLNEHTAAKVPAATGVPDNPKDAEAALDRGARARSFMTYGLILRYVATTNSPKRCLVKVGVNHVKHLKEAGLPLPPGVRLCWNMEEFRQEVASSPP